MKRVALLGLMSAFAFSQGASAQSAATQASPSAQSPTSATAQPRPDANYAKPSGQDSQPNRKPTPPKKSMTTGSSNGTVENRGAHSSDQSTPAQQVAKQKVYKGNTGNKSDPGTACNTARPTPNGGVDCGTGGKGATPGKVPK